jgi:hypothetical protein
MNDYDFNDAEKQQSFEPIPAKTIVKTIFNIQPGGVGPAGWLTASKSSDAEMVVGEFMVTEGEFIRRRWWQYMVVSGGKQNDQGQSIAGNITRQTLRAILESCRNINPDDESAAAMEKRKISGWGDFDRMEFVCRVGIEVDKTGRYADKNKILEIITPDMEGYAVPPPHVPATSPPQMPPAHAAQTTATGNPTPAWAQ